MLKRVDNFFREILPIYAKRDRYDRSKYSSEQPIPEIETNTRLGIQKYRFKLAY